MGYEVVEWMRIDTDTFDQRYAGRCSKPRRAGAQHLQRAGTATNTARRFDPDGSPHGLPHQRHGYHGRTSGRVEPGRRLDERRPGFLR